MHTLGDDFPVQQARVREIMANYRAIGPAGAFRAKTIEDVLARADRAAIGGNVFQILRSYEELKGIEG